MIIKPKFDVIKWNCKELNDNLQVGLTASWVMNILPWQCWTNTTENFRIDLANFILKMNNLRNSWPDNFHTFNKTWSWTGRPENWKKIHPIFLKVAKRVAKLSNFRIQTMLFRWKCNKFAAQGFTIFGAISSFQTITMSLQKVAQLVKKLLNLATLLLNKNAQNWI